MTYEQRVYALSILCIGFLRISVPCSQPQLFFAFNSLYWIRGVLQTTSQTASAFQFFVLDSGSGGVKCPRPRSQVYFQFFVLDSIISVVMGVLFGLGIFQFFVLDSFNLEGGFNSFSIKSFNSLYWIRAWARVGSVLDEFYSTFNSLYWILSVELLADNTDHEVFQFFVLDSPINLKQKPSNNQLSILCIGF